MKKVSKLLIMIISLCLLLSTIALASDKVNFSYYSTGPAQKYITGSAYKDKVGDAKVNPSTGAGSYGEGIRYSVKRGVYTQISSLESVSGSATRTNLTNFGISYYKKYDKKSHYNKLYVEFLYSGNKTAEITGNWSP